MAVAAQTAPERDGIYSHIDEEVYHADVDSLSSSGAQKLASTTPAEFHYSLLHPPASKKAYDFGHLCHKMALGCGGDFAVLDPLIHGRKTDGSRAEQPKSTKAWKDAEAHAKSRGKTPVTAEQMDAAQRMAGKIFEHPLAGKLLQSGAAELSGWWHDEQTGVRLRFRPDFLPDTGGRPIIVDVKTSQTANPRRFARSCFDFGYYQQGAFYIDGLAATTGATDAAFVFVVVQKDEPWLVSVCQLEPEDIAYGRAQNRAAIDLYAKCRESGVWPGYDGLATVALPGWARRQIQEDLT
jgi:hypothetical protein